MPFCTGNTGVGREMEGRGSGGSALLSGRPESRTRDRPYHIRWRSCYNSFFIYIQVITINALVSFSNKRRVCMHLKTDQNGTEEPCQVYTAILCKLT